MPVGNASDGIGLYAGQVMFSANMNIQHIDWSHDPTEDENFDHWGHLNSTILIPNITLGLSDYWNISYSQIIAVRTMGFGPHEESKHHRDESSLDDFINANGGLLGDGKLKFKYLLNNTGMLAGNRTFLSFGLLIPSNNVLTASPFYPDGQEVEEHRHFALSDGNYKGLIEIQYFNKRKNNPVFWGLKLDMHIPFKDSNYGYSAGKSYSLAFSSLFKPNKKIADLGIVGLSAGIVLLHTNDGYWDDFLDPSSKSTMIIPSIGGIWELGGGGVSLNLQNPLLIDGIGMTNENTLNNDFKAIEITIGYRYTLDYVIDWLYF